MKLLKQFLKADKLMSTVSLVGCAHIHTPGFVKMMQERSDVTVKYVWDHDMDRAQRWAETLGAQAIASPDTVWEDDSVEATIICSETNRHAELVKAATKAKKHLFVEKPLGLSAKDSYAMAQAIEDAGVIFQTGYFMRGNPFHQFLRDQILAENFGKITRFRHTNCHQGSLGGWFDTEWRWMADPTIAGCGAFGDLGTHSLDIMLWMMGKVSSVAASIHVATGRYGDCDEFGEGLLNFSNGVVGTLAAGWVDLGNPANIIISGTEGLAYVCGGQLFFKSDHVTGADGNTPWTDLPPALPHAFMLFLDALQGQDVPLVSAREAAERSAVMAAMYEGARLQQWVEPEYPTVMKD